MSDHEAGARAQHIAALSIRYSAERARRITARRAQGVR